MAKSADSVIRETKAKIFREGALSYLEWLDAGRPGELRNPYEGSNYD